MLPLSLSLATGGVWSPVPKRDQMPDLLLRIARERCEASFRELFDEFGPKLAIVRIARCSSCRARNQDVLERFGGNKYGGYIHFTAREIVSRVQPGAVSAPRS